LPHLFPGVGDVGDDSRGDEGKLVTGANMSCSDPIADMLARVRNAHMARQETVEFQHSKLKEEIVRVLKREGYLSDYVVEGNPRKVMRVYLKYTAKHMPVIQGLRRTSSPGGRVFVGVGKIPKPLGGIGTAVISTSQGIMTDKEARKKKIGGEVLCTVW
jgi:small subunit ribosomal protein S8